MSVLLFSGQSGRVRFRAFRWTVKLCVRKFPPDLMPTYPSRGSTAAYLDEGHAFDVRKTPSTGGALTEVFRTWPGAPRASWAVLRAGAARSRGPPSIHLRLSRRRWGWAGPPRGAAADGTGTRPPPARPPPRTARRK